VAELAIRTIDCGIVAMVALGYGGPSPVIYRPNIGEPV